jgi:predicted Zn-dependent peptidase
MSKASRRLRAGALFLALSSALGSASATEVDIPFETFTLPNGLRVVVHEDRKAPVVAVNVWYHVGSKDERPGKTGFAHLFEHLMFQGSENHDGEFFEPFQLVGATNQNGTTNNDRTNYFQNVPTTALEMALFMESDRMGHLLGAVTQEALDEQRGVVQNEKRQRENQPYGQAWDALSRASYPAGHPYSWSVIGSMADLNAASMQDVQDWFRAWYGPNNAVLVLAGDIDVETARTQVERYFGDIPAGPTLPQPEVDVARRTERTREVLNDRVPQARIYRSWNVAEFGNPDVERLQLVAQVLGGSRTSRLNTRLVHQERLVDSVSAFMVDNQLGGNFILVAQVKQGVDPAAVEAAMDEELARLIAEGPTAEELEQAKTVFEAGFIRGIERVGGFGGKSDVLAACAVFAGDPGCFRESLRLIESATPAEVQAAAANWLATGDHTLVVAPGERPPSPPDVRSVPVDGEDTAIQHPPVDPRFRTIATDVDRSQGVPQTTEFPQLTFPALQRATLSNGMRVVLAERHDVPVVQFSMEIPGGYSADQGRKLGTASFAMSMLDDGAGGRSALELGAEIEALGANMGAGASLDGSNIYLSAIKEKLDESLALWADVVRRPDFAEAEIERVRAQWIAGIAQEKARPDAIPLRLLPPLMYGEGHPYAIPFTGTGTTESIASLTRQDLLDFHAEQVRPDRATLIVVGDTTLEEIVPKLEAVFADWRAEGTPVAAPALPEVARPSGSRVFLVDQPGASQANILVGQAVPSTRDPGALDFDIANGVIGGTFTSRLNMNLREDKSWSYGVRSFTQGAIGQRPWIVSAPVQIDRTADSLAEMRREITEFATGARPASADEVARVTAGNVRALPGSYETAGAVMGAIGGILRYDRPDDYVARYQARNEAITVDEVNASARQIDPDALLWVVVGDLSKIEAPVRALELGEVQVIDADGNPVER